MKLKTKKKSLLQRSQIKNIEKVTYLTFVCFFFIVLNLFLKKLTAFVKSYKKLFFNFILLDFPKCSRELIVKDIAIFFLSFCRKLLRPQEIALNRLWHQKPCVLVKHFDSDLFVKQENWFLQQLQRA